MWAYLLGIAVTTLVLFWLLHFRGGLAFKSDNKQKIFNLHPLLMIVGLILPAGEAIVAGIVGIYVVFKFYHELGIPDMYTLHSWLGMSTICLFGLQKCLQGQASLHVMFLMAILCAETGLVEKFLFLGLWRSQEALIVNFIGLLILLFGISVGLTVLLPGRR